MSVNTDFGLQDMNKKELVAFISQHINSPSEELIQTASTIRDKNYGKRVFLRGLIEVSNYCKNDCFYCGIRRSNKNVDRYRLSKQEILHCAEVGYSLGFRTFVLQGGEDLVEDEIICELILALKKNFPDVAVTLSLGEKSYDVYKSFKEAGADRYLLRHEAAEENLYSKLHPSELKLSERKNCLYTLKELGFQVGAGFLVDPPGQTLEDLAEDLLFLKKLNPQMVGIGPFIPHKDTVFRNEKAGRLEATLAMIAMVRILLPKALLPSTTALSTISPNGRILGLKCGGNVVMPNLSPQDVRKNYMLYDNKQILNEEAAEGLEKLKRQVEEAGFVADMARGDHLDF